MGRDCRRVLHFFKQVNGSLANGVISDVIERGRKHGFPEWSAPHWRKKSIADEIL
jgi:hypothetical protein